MIRLPVQLAHLVSSAPHVSCSSCVAKTGIAQQKKLGEYEANSSRSDLLDNVEMILINQVLRNYDAGIEFRIMYSLAQLNTRQGNVGRSTCLDGASMI